MSFIMEVAQKVSVATVMVLLSSTLLSTNAKADWFGAASLKDLGAALGGAGGHELCKRKGVDMQMICSAVAAGGVALVGGENAENAVVTGIGAGAGSRITKSGWGAAVGAGVAHNMNKAAQKERSSPFKQVTLDDGSNAFMVPVPALGSVNIYIQDYMIPNGSRPLTIAQTKALSKETFALNHLISRYQTLIVAQIENGETADLQGAAEGVQTLVNTMINKYSQMASLQHINTAVAVQKMVNVLQVGTKPLYNVDVNANIANNNDYSNNY